MQNMQKIVKAKAYCAASMETLRQLPAFLDRLGYLTLQDGLFLTHMTAIEPSPTKLMTLLGWWGLRIPILEKSNRGTTKVGGEGENNASSVGGEEKDGSVRHDGKGQRAGIMWAKHRLI